MVKIIIPKHSYLAGDELDIEIDFSASTELVQNLKNININIYRIDVERNNLAFGFGAEPETSGTIVQIRRKLPEDFKEGVYGINGLKLIYGENNATTKFLAPGKDVPEVYFWVTRNTKKHLDEEALAVELERLSAARNNYWNTELITEAAQEQRNNTKLFRVFVFAVGCLVHAPQNMAGYAIYPLGRGFKYEHMFNAVNDFLKEKHDFLIPYEEEIEMRFSQSTPLFVIEFKNVRALEYRDAALHCITLSERIFIILSYEKEERPRPFATIIVDTEINKSWQFFHFPGYSGNLVSDFNPASTGNMIERILPLMEQSPWVELLLRSLGDAMSEKNPNFAYLKSWAIVELVAKKRVVDENLNIFSPNGEIIKYSSGQPVMTSTTIGKVYWWLFHKRLPSAHISISNNRKIMFETYQEASSDPNVSAETEVITLWDAVQAAYEIRNSTAHTGEFNLETAEQSSERGRLAARMYKIPNHLFLNHIRETAKLVVSWELHQEEELMT